jgi:hypothetical protein
MSKSVWSWSGPNGGRIEVGFDDKHFGLEEMHTEIAAMRKAHPTLPDEVPQGTVFTFSAEKSTGHLLARFRVGNTVYRNVVQRSVHQLWDTVHLIDQLLHPERYKKLAS